MNKQLRKAVIAGNWKMNKTPSQTTALVEEMKPLVKGADCDVVICVPYVDLQAALEATKGSNIKVGAEKLPLGKERRLHRRNFYGDAHGDGRRVCCDRPQRAPHLFW